MTKKDSQRESLRYLETPTAAFPIGSLHLDKDNDGDLDENTALQEFIDDLEQTEPNIRHKLPDDDDDERDTEVLVVQRNLFDGGESQREPGVHPALLALSLLGGGVLAIGVVTVFGMLLLYVN